MDTFVAPSRTFHDILRSSSWWLPFVILVISGYLLTAAIQSKVGWQQLVQNEIHSNAQLSDKMAALPADQLAVRERMMQTSFRGSFYAGPLLSLAIGALFALVLWGTMNFGFGGKATFGRMFSMGMYAGLPRAISALVATAMLYGGRSPETFTTQSMLGSNPGYYINAPGALKTFLSAFDLFTLWTLVLLAIGASIVAGTHKRAGYIAVFGWFLLIVIFRTAMAAVNS